MRNLFYQTWTEAKKNIQKSNGVIIPFGSVEQHGHHLPLGTDTILAHAFAEELCKRENLYFYPCISFGQVWSAKEFESTISIRPACLKEYGLQVVDSVMRVHPKRVFLFSFHNGNHKVIDDLLRERLDREGPEHIYHIKAGGIVQEAKDILTTPLWNGNVWHAGELETSLMLHVAGELVNMQAATVEFPSVPPLYAIQPIPWRRFLKSGAFGDTTAATAEKGKKLFELICSELQGQIRSAEKYEKP